MVISKTELQSQVVKLSSEAFETFCDDVSAMFDIEMACQQQNTGTLTVADIKKDFKKFAAINAVKADGSLDGNFYLIFDNDGLFTVAGVIVMLPEQKILENRSKGSTKEAQEMSDAFGEAGNLLVGAWDKIFRENLEGHGHFTQAKTFIGNPWNNPKETIGLAADTEFVYVPYQMIIGAYPSFNCGVIFPKTIFNEKAGTVEKKPGIQKSAAVEKKPDHEIALEALEAENPAKSELVGGQISETIERMVLSSANLPGEYSKQLSSILAKNVMQTQLLWGNVEDSVQQAMAKMQQADTGYMLVGADNVLEGIVSNYDIGSALSIYLKPMFAKWRTPLDDATLQIRVKWIMTRPVTTLKPETSLATIMETMRKTGLKSLPVVDQNGKTIGLVTVFDIFKAILEIGSKNFTAGKSPQAPAMA